MNKIKKISILCFIGILLISLIGCGQSSSEQNTIKVGTCADYPPFEFIKNNEIQGFDIDLAKAIAKELGKEVKIVDLDFNTLIASLQAGKIDLAIASLSINEERKQNVDFSDVYFSDHLSVIYKTNNFPEVNKLSKEDLNGKKIGTQLGSIMEKFAKTIENASVVSLSKHQELINELKLNRINAVICGEKQAIEFCKKDPSLNFKTIGVSSDGSAIALKKGSELTNKINRIISKLKEEKYLNQLQQKWLGENYGTL